DDVALVTGGRLVEPHDGGDDRRYHGQQYHETDDQRLVRRRRRSRLFWLPTRRFGRLRRRRQLHGAHPPPSPTLACMPLSARSPSARRITHEIRIGEVEIISMLIPSAASASNMSAATPGWLFIPAPTSETFAT